MNSPEDSSDWAKADAAANAKRSDLSAGDVAAVLRANLLAWCKRELPYVLAAYAMIAIALTSPAATNTPDAPKAIESSTGQPQAMMLDQARLEQLIKSYPDLAIWIGLMGMLASGAFFFGLALLGWWGLQRLQDRDPLDVGKPWIERRWGLWDVFKTCFMYFFLLGVTGHAIRLACLNSSILDWYRSMSEVQQGLLMQLPGSTLIIVVILYIMKVEKGHDLTGLGCVPSLDPIIKGLLSYFAVIPPVLASAFAGLAIVKLLGYEQQGHPVAEELFGDHPMWTMVMMVFFACVLAPIWEEFLFRGMLYPVLRKLLNVPTAIGLSAIIFAVIHMNASQVAPICVLGVLLALLYEKTQSLWSCIAAHMIFNTGSMTLLFTMRYLNGRLDDLQPVHSVLSAGF